MPLPYSIDYQSKIFGLGSCFVDHIKTKLNYYQFQTLINPYGTVFNPHSIKKLLQYTVNQPVFTEKVLFKHENIWKHFDFHTAFNRLTVEEYLNNLHHTIHQAKGFLQSADWAFFTLGTAWVYRHKITGKIVNNCHKVPQKEFEKILLSTTEIIDELKEIRLILQQINPHIKLLLTVSPVRHLKDGFTENQRSKARLIEAVHSVVNHSHTFYFPSYEIMMDDLRDYRFYTSDLLHPNEQAVAYIWEIFTRSIIKQDILPDMKQIEKIQKQLQHKSFTGQPVTTVKLQTAINQIKQKYPWMHFELKE